MSADAEQATFDVPTSLPATNNDIGNVAAEIKEEDAGSDDELKVEEGAEPKETAPPSSSPSSPAPCNVPSPASPVSPVAMETEPNLPVQPDEQDQSEEVKTAEAKAAEADLSRDEGQGQGQGNDEGRKRPKEPTVQVSDESPASPSAKERRVSGGIDDRPPPTAAAEYPQQPPPPYGGPPPPPQHRHPGGPPPPCGSDPPPPKGATPYYPPASHFPPHQQPVTPPHQPGESHHHRVHPSSSSSNAALRYHGGPSPPQMVSHRPGGSFVPYSRGQTGSQDQGVPPLSGHPRHGHGDGHRHHHRQGHHHPHQNHQEQHGNPGRPMPNVSRSGSDSEHSNVQQGGSSSEQQPSSSTKSPGHQEGGHSSSSKSPRPSSAPPSEGGNTNMGKGDGEENDDGSNNYSLADFEPPRAEPIEHHHRFQPAYAPPPSTPASRAPAEHGSGSRRRRANEEGVLAEGGKRQRVLSDLSEGIGIVMPTPYSPRRLEEGVRHREGGERSGDRGDRQQQRRPRDHSYGGRGRSRSPHPPHRGHGQGHSGPPPPPPPPPRGHGPPGRLPPHSASYPSRGPNGAFAPLPTLQSYDSQILHSWSSQGSSSGGRQSPTDVRVCYDSFSRQLRNNGSMVIGQVPSANMSHSRTWDDGPGGGNGSESSQGTTRGAPPTLQRSQGPPAQGGSSPRYSGPPTGRYGDHRSSQGGPPPPNLHPPPPPPQGFQQGQGQPQQGQYPPPHHHQSSSSRSSGPSSSRRPPPVDTRYSYDGYEPHLHRSRSSAGAGVRSGPPPPPDYHRQYPGYGPPTPSSSSSKDRPSGGGQPSPYPPPPGPGGDFSPHNHRSGGSQGDGRYLQHQHQHYAQGRDDVDMPSPTRSRSHGYGYGHGHGHGHGQHHQGRSPHGRGGPTPPHGWSGRAGQGQGSYPPPPPHQQHQQGHYDPRSGDPSPRGHPTMSHPGTPQHHTYSSRQDHGGSEGISHSRSRGSVDDGPSSHSHRGRHDDSRREPSPPSSDDPLQPHPYHGGGGHHSSRSHHHNHHEHHQHRSSQAPPPVSHGGAGGPPSAMITHDTTIAGLRTPDGVLLLAQPDDRISLSETLCVVRENVEVFTATEEDVKAPAPGRKRPVVVGQVGLRCIHCRSETKPGARVKRAVCFPSSIKRIYRTVIDMKLDHFKACRYVPDALKSKLAELKANNARSTGTTMQYFVQAAKKMGMADGPNGVRYDPDAAAEVERGGDMDMDGGGGRSAFDALGYPGHNLSMMSSHSHSEFGSGGRPIGLSHSLSTADGSSLVMAGSMGLGGVSAGGIANAPIGAVSSSLSMDSSGNEDSGGSSKGGRSKDKIFKRKQGDPPRPGEKAGPESHFFHGKVLLSLPEDKSALSPLRCFLRDNVYAFSATPEDIAVRTPTTFSVVLGQVGIGCKHCYNLPAKERSNRAVCFPFSISRIYQSVADIQRFHLAECRMVPDEARKEFAALQSASSKGSKGLATRQYWVTSAKKLGLCDTERGIRFNRDPSEPIAAALSLDILARVASDVTTASKPLVFDEDRPHIAEFLFLVMEQLQPCRFTEADRNKRRMKDLGCVGVECRHCAGQVESRKFFWSSVNAVESNFVSVHTHMMECKMVPQETKDELARLKLLRKEQTARLKTGSQKAFFAKVWERLHADDGKKKGQGQGQGEGQQHGQRQQQQDNVSGDSKSSASMAQAPSSSRSTPVTPERKSKEPKHHTHGHGHHHHSHHGHHFQRGPGQQQVHFQRPPPHGHGHDFPPPAVQEQEQKRDDDDSEKSSTDSVRKDMSVIAV